MGLLDSLNFIKKVYLKIKTIEYYDYHCILEYNNQKKHFGILA